MIWFYFYVLTNNLNLKSTKELLLLFCYVYSGIPLIWSPIGHEHSAIFMGKDQISWLVLTNMSQLKDFVQKEWIWPFGPMLIFCRIELVLADWLSLTWKTLFCNCFCWFVCRFWEITYAKNSVFQAVSFGDLLLNGKRKKPFVVRNQQDSTDNESWPKRQYIPFLHKILQL